MGISLKRYANTQLAHKMMLDIINHHQNENENENVILPHELKYGQNKKDM